MRKIKYKLPTKTDVLHQDICKQIEQQKQLDGVKDRPTNHQVAVLEKTLLFINSRSIRVLTFLTDQSIFFATSLT